MRSFGLALLMGFAFSAVLPAENATACSCVGLTQDEALDIASVAFQGELVAIDVADLAVEYYDSVFVFEVDQVFKGEAFELQHVISPPPAGECGLEIRELTTYLVFAEASRDSLSAISCGGTRPALGYQAGLPPGKPALPGATEPAARVLTPDISRAPFSEARRFGLLAAGVFVIAAAVRSGSRRPL